MAINPYDATATRGEVRKRRYFVKLYLVLAAILAPLGIAVSIPGATLLNQEYGWFATETIIYNIEFNGYPVSNESAIQCSIGFALILFISAILLLALALRNFRRNGKTQQSADHM